MQQRRYHGVHGHEPSSWQNKRYPCPPFVSVVSVFALLTAFAPACARAHAKTTPDAPPLEMPPPPPRDVEPAESEAATTGAEASRPGGPRSSRPAPAPTREPARPEAPKPESPAEAPKPAEEPRAPTTLQTAPATAEGEQARAIRATLARATADLNRIDSRSLNPDARTQYDTAKRFIRQADDAVRAKNLVFAKNLADKAAALAAQLGGR